MAFDRAIGGSAARMVRSDHVETDLDVHRWRADASGEDAWLLDRCAGPAIDLGCGPGRLVAALVGRRVPALGVDRSRAAARLCWRRGAPMVRRDVFGPLPAEGCWDHALLADGNIGIGGDPLRLLRRTEALLRPGGTVLVEADPRPGLWLGTVRIRTGSEASAAVPWASVGVDALAELAEPAGLWRTAVYAGRRRFVELRSGEGPEDAIATALTGPARRWPAGGSGSRGSPAPRWRCRSARRGPR